MSNTEQPVATVEMTNVKGYFNPNPYKVNLTISELNMSVPLGPMEFLLERGTGRKINDPIFDKYVGHKMLAPEMSDRPVPILRVPTARAPQPSTGHVVGQGYKDAAGRWQPSLPASRQPSQLPNQVATQIPDASRPSIRAMTVEQARAAGFLGKTRLVEESYGADETDAPSTRNNLPSIKYSIESAAPKARPGELPPELKEEIRPEVAPLIAGLQSAAQQDPEKVNLGRRAAEAAVQEQQGVEGVKKFRATAKEIKAKAKVAQPVAQAPAPAPAPASAAPRRVVAQPVAPAAPAPAIEDSPLMGGRPADLPQPVLEEVQAPKAQPKPQPEAEPGPTAEDRADGRKFKCAACGKDFEYKSYYNRHVRRAHRDRLQELLVP